MIQQNLSKTQKTFTNSHIPTKQDIPLVTLPMQGVNPLIFSELSKINAFFMLSLSSITMMKNVVLSRELHQLLTQSWYTEWYGKKILAFIHAQTKCLSYFKWFGMAAFAVTIVNNLQLLKKELLGYKHLDLDNNASRKKDFIKAGHTTANILATAATSVFYFGLNMSSISGPLFIAIFCISTLKASYSMAKNAYQLSHIKQKMEQSGAPKTSYLKIITNNTSVDRLHEKGKASINEERHYAELMYRRTKLLRSSFDVACGLVGVGLVVLWVTNPAAAIPAIIGFALLAGVNFAGRKYLDAKAKHYKSQTQTLSKAIKRGETTGTTKDYKLFSLPKHFAETSSCQSRRFYMGRRT